MQKININLIKKQNWSKIYLAYGIDEVCFKLLYHLYNIQYYAYTCYYFPLVRWSQSVVHVVVLTGLLYTSFSQTQVSKQCACLSLLCCSRCVFAKPVFFPGPYGGEWMMWSSVGDPGSFLTSSPIMICNFVILIVHNVNQLSALSIATSIACLHPRRVIPPHFALSEIFHFLSQ